MFSRVLKVISPIAACTIAASFMMPAKAENLKMHDEEKKKVLSMPNIYQVKYAPPKTVFHDHTLGTSNLYAPAIPPSQEKTQELLAFLRKQFHWVDRNANHKTSWYVDEGWEIDYEYDKGQAQPWNHMPPWLKVLRDHMMEELNLPRDRPPNSCNVNWYSDGSAGLGAHADDEFLFEGVLYPIKIIGLSLGAERPFQILNKDATEILGEIVLPNFSYVTMEGMTQKNLKHRIPKVKQSCGPRLNITWRWIVRRERTEDNINNRGL